jgi:PTH1 family peptidyl-tRNA hydrolase
VKLIVGLGNPGKKYVSTRHNVGFWVVERLAVKLWREEKKLRAAISGPYESRGVIAKDQRLETKDRYLLAKPATFMNRSGEAVAELMKEFAVAARDVWLIHDDADLALGAIRIQESGKRSTHNGVQSTVEMLGGQVFARFRLGIGLPPPGIDWEDYVLNPFPPEQTGIVNKGVERATEAVETALAEGIVAAMNRYNGS